MPAIVFVLSALERRIQIFPDVVAIPYILMWFLLAPTCVLCGIVLLVYAFRNCHTKIGTLLSAIAGITEIGIGITIGLSLAGMKFITPQT